MVMLLLVLNLERDGDLRVKTANFALLKISMRFKREAVDAFHQRSGLEQMTQPAIGVRGAAADFLPASTLLNFQRDLHARGGAPERSIEYVRGNLAHSPRSFSKRSRVIFF